MTDARGKRTDYSYDAADRLTRTQDALGQIWRFSYDGAGNMTGTVFPDTTSVARTFTEHDLVSTVRYSADPTAYDFSYSAANRLSSVTDQAGKTYSYDHNPLGWLTGVTDTFDAGVVGGFATTVGYDEAGRVTSLKASSEASRTYGYDLRGDLTSLALPGEASLHTTYAYDAARQLKAATLPNGSVTGYAYDADGLLASIAATLPSGVISHTYDRNENGKVTSENAELFSYDDLGRLASWYDASTAATTTYAYDAAFNLASVTRDGTTLRSFTVDDANRITSSSFTYDGRGNLTSDGERTYAYDAANRLTSVKNTSTGATLATYAYDDFNRRVRATEGAATTVFHYAGTSGNVIAETDGAGTTVTTYAYGAGGRLHSMTRGGATYYYHLSARGDVVALSNAAGNVVNTYRYDPWGNVLASSETVANPYRYASYRFDAVSGLYYCWNRSYAPGLGRFLQRDLVPGQLTRPASMNPYAYCENDPVNRVDHTGLMSNAEACLLLDFVSVVAATIMVTALIVGGTMAIIGTGGLATPVVAGLTMGGIAGAAGLVGAGSSIAREVVFSRDGGRSPARVAEARAQAAVSTAYAADSVLPRASRAGQLACDAASYALAPMDLYLSLQSYQESMRRVHAEWQ